MKAGIFGGAGYAAGELIRLLAVHPEAELVFVQSQSHAGRPLSDAHAGLDGLIDMEFTAEPRLDEIDVLFLCSGHGASSEFWANHEAPAGLKVIDLAQDYRDESFGYVYGLPEYRREKIAGATHVANPGCFATCIQLALLPLAKAGKLNGDVQITAITGSTGAGVKPAATTHFSWRNDNLSIYKPFTHQHLAEIGRTLRGLQPDWEGRLNFVPMRGPFARGIFASVYMDTDLTQEEATALYEQAYADEPFAAVARKELDMKQVVNTNMALVEPRVIEGKLLVAAAVDNLLKGAAGQAVQNMNIMFGLDERAGLRLKPSAF